MSIFCRLAMLLGYKSEVEEAETGIKRESKKTHTQDRDVDCSKLCDAKKNKAIQSV